MSDSTLSVYVAMGAVLSILLVIGLNLWFNPPA
jgi:hypothetical protein